MKHALTKVIFSKLYLDMRDTALVSHHDLTPGLGDLIEAEERSRTYYRGSDSMQGREGGTWMTGAGTTAGPSTSKGLH